MPKDPKTVPCQWCGEPSVDAIELLRRTRRGIFGTGCFAYACRKHVDVAVRIAGPENRSKAGS